MNSNMWKTSLPSNVSASMKPQTFGLTPPISVAEPKPEDIRKSQDLKKVLESYQVFESDTELMHRMEVLSKLNILVKEWARDLAVSRNMPSQAVEKLGVKIYTFGSYRLGVHDKGADIDTLCVVPRDIDRFDFFTSFFELLKKQPGVTDCRAIEKAFVPVIKMNFDGIDIDLLFARLALKAIPDNINLCDDQLLKNLDPKSMRSLNGFRVADEILNLVPNKENFRSTLRTIKLWAKEHGIYSNSLGYFGGVTWAMLVARTCQLYPNAAPATLVHKFFLVCSNWKWPQPVLLKWPEDKLLGFPVWDPRVNLSDRYHLMPIITPAYPHQNSTFNVCESTKTVILREFRSAMRTMSEIALGKADWDQLFQAPSFFYKYRHFIVLLVTSNNVDGHSEWCGLVESKIRLLVGSLERQQHICTAHVNPKRFHLHKEKSSKDCISSVWFIGIEFVRMGNLDVDLTASIGNFTTQVYSYAENLQDGMEIAVQHVTRKQLSQYLDADFLRREKQRAVKLATTEAKKRPLTQMTSQAIKKTRLSG